MGGLRVTGTSRHGSPQGKKGRWKTIDLQSYMVSVREEEQTLPTVIANGSKDRFNKFH